MARVMPSTSVAPCKFAQTSLSYLSPQDSLWPIMLPFAAKRLFFPTLSLFFFEKENTVLTLVTPAESQQGGPGGGTLAPGTVLQCSWYEMDDSC